ncbi:MAG TPA: glycosyltransferase family A protein [Bryobacteraceae bacterium]|nr:glycosyltransferase family A protein [Bryobacteraceae bacterium]
MSRHPTFSILLATVGRTTEVRKFLAALAAQTNRSFELLAIDQNPDDRLKELLDPYRGEFSIRHLRSDLGHSRAFNLGLAHVSGDVVAFPDDDCWYDPDLLDRVARVMQEHPGASGVTGREIVEPGFTSGGRWDQGAGPVTRANVFRRAISFTVFLRRAVATAYQFDESLGVGAGTQWGAGEETDYLLSLIREGKQLWYDSSIAVWHQGRSGPYTDATCAKARSYGMGMGRVLRKHDYSRLAVGRHVFRPACGALLALLSANPAKAKYHWSIFAGRAMGWRGAVEPLALRPRESERSLISMSGERLP